MAYSIIEFNNKYQRIHDLDLSIACFLIMEQKEIMKSQLLEQMFEDWVDSISYDGSGCIDLNLNEYLRDSETMHILKKMIKKTLQKLDDVPDLYTTANLNPILAKAKICLKNDYRTDLIKNALTGLMTLLE